MSRIRRLSVLGIRNFADDEEASIRFSRPLTLILGQNGTGKTTIIEALKFATCGEFPPNSDRGKFFIHDPTLTKTCSVRAVVKAEIIDSSGNVYTICRTLESSKANVTMRFKTLDSALSRMNKKTKEVVSITNRCANVDTELTLAMGVSIPILEYVIFCHQEDLNWPFQDGKKLKEKFDEIFDTAKFNVALERILKLTRNMKQEIDLLKEQKKSCLHIVGEVQDKEAKLDDHKKRLESCKTKVDEIKKEIEPINCKIQEMENIDSNYKDLVIEEKKKKAEYDVSMQRLNGLKEDIQNIFDGTMEELLLQIESYDVKLTSKTFEIEEFSTKLVDISKQDSKVSKMLADERVVEGSLKQQIQDQNNKVSLRNNVLNEILSVWNLNPIDSNVSEIEATATFKRLEGKMQKLEQTAEESRIKEEEEEKQLQKEIDYFRSEHSKIESEKNLKENEVVEVGEEIDQIKSEIIQLDTSATKLNSITAKMKDMRTKVDELNEALDVDDARKKILAKTKLRDETEALLNATDKEIASMLKQSSLQTELELHKSTLISKEKEMQALKQKHQDTIMTLLNVEKLSEKKLKNDLDMVQKELVNQIDCITQQIKTAEHSSTTLETTISHTEHELQNKRKEIELNKEKISLFCDYKDFDETLLLQSKKVKDLQDKRGMYAHRSVAYKEYMKQLKATKPCCPLCHRGFSERETVVNLLMEMENEMKDHPNRLKECETELKVQQEKYNKMLELKPVVEKVIQLEETELQKLMDNLEKCNIKLVKSRISIVEMKERKSKPENKVTMFRDIMGDIMLWDRYIDEISNLKQVTDDIELRINNAGSTTERSIEEVQAQREKLKMSLKNINNEIESLQSTINTHNEQLHNVREKYNALQEEQLKIRSGVQKLKQLKDKQEELYAKEISLGKSLDTLRKTVTAAKNELNLAIDKLEKKKNAHRVEQENVRKVIAERTRRLSELRMIQHEINTSIQRKIPESLQRSEKRIKDWESLINELQREKNDIESTINKLKAEITRHDILKRELSDNVTLRKTQETIEILQKECSNLKQKLSAINYKQVVQEWQSLQKRKESLLRQENIAKGSQEELERIIRQYTQELQKDMYRHARKKLRHKCIELTVREKAVSDLKEYSKALDISMMECHRERMSTVNRIMKQMWRLVYTGRDTTSIEIRADATEGVGSTKRSYNYKLVQTKHGHEMDMKGRCSAGQKVLASIIIRLALAETFCKDCGILALDEPTTNLDQENTDSLAEALAKVVKLRSQHQKNFQLIIISHDEKFLLKLAELNENKGFYELYRKDNGYTAIRHCQVESRDHFVTDTVKEEMSSDEEQTETKLQKKRTKDDAWSSNDEQQSENRASKKRYVLNI